MSKDTSKIPHGPYCYEIYPIDFLGLAKKVYRLCPYWSVRAGKREQESGYCSYLEKGDWMEDGTMLLWDQVKECGINTDFDENWGN